MNPLSWAQTVTQLAARLRVRYPHLTLDDLAHPPSRPCPRPCPSCSNRHGPNPPKKGCPCLICHTRHGRSEKCPRYTPGEGRPGCLACRVADDTQRAVAVADLGDGVRSPSLEPGGGGGGPASAKYEDDDERGGVSTPTERAALSIDHRDAYALADAAMHRQHVLDSLRLALQASVPAEAAQSAREATRQAQQAVRALDRFQPTHKPPADPGTPSCPSCWRAQLFSVTRTPTSSLCRRCEDWKRDTGRLPPLGVLEAWRDGKRLTTAVVQQAERAEKDRNKRKRKKAS